MNAMAFTKSSATRKLPGWSMFQQQIFGFISILE